MAIEIFITIFLVLLNGFFVAAEFAIVKVRTSQIESRPGSARITTVARNILHNLDGYLAATQLGITLASLGLGWVGEDVVTKLILNVMHSLNLTMTEESAHRIAVPVAFATITILHIVFGELAPKSIAIRKPAPTTFVVALPLRIFYFIFRPFIWMLNGLANLILRIVGIQPVHEHDLHTEEELKIIVSESQKGGVIDETEKDIIHNVFNLSERKITSLMTPRNEIVWIDVNDEMMVTRDKIMNNRHNVYPLCQDDIDNILGFIYTKDLLSGDFEQTLQRLEDYKRPAFYIPETNKTYQVLERFKESRIHQAVIVDEYGSITGIVTINDIFDALVGDISETNEFEYEVTEREDGSMLIDAQIPFVDFLQRLEILDAEEKKSGDFITLAGFILDKLKKIPATGDKFTWNNYDIEVIDMDKSRIDKVLVTKLEQEEPEEE